METPACFAFDERASAVDEVHSQTAIYTTTTVVESLLNRIGWPNDGGRLIDPSCGDGAFMIAALRRLNLQPDSEASLSRVRGYEIHPGAVVDARERIASYLVDRGWKAVRAEACAREMVVEADFLTEFRDEKFDYVAGNPPYLRFTFLPRYFQDLYRGRLPLHTQGDLLHAFLDACVRMLSADGVIAFVTSDRWLFNETAGELRAKLGELVGIHHVARLDCDTSFYRPKRRVTGSLPRVHPVEVVLRPCASAPRALTSAPVVIDSGSDAVIPSRVLTDIADVRLSPWLGTDGVWTVDVATANKLGLENLLSVVDVKDVVPGTDTLVGYKRMAILTQRDVEPTGAVRDHLLKMRHTLPDRAVRSSTWWMPPERIDLSLLNQSMLMVPKIGQRLRAIPVPSGCLPYNHQHVLIPKEGITLDELAAIVTCEASQRWFRIHAAPIENSYFQINTGILRQLPV